MSIKTIGVFTSGGDSPGMNACIRAVVRTGIYHQLNVVGIMRGYEGLIDGEFIEMQASSVSNIIQRGGTILKTARSQRFFSKEGREKAFQKLKEAKIDALVAIGGDGTFKGAEIFHSEYGIPVIGCAGTIDNDLYGTDFTIGYDTAINTAVQTIDKIRDTAASHDRIFIVEVMGRDAGFIALRSGIGSGAEAVLVPEIPTSFTHLDEVLQKGWNRQKSSSIIVVAEGDDAGGAYKIAEYVKSKYGIFDLRVSILGHIQRGGSPTAMDRVLASETGMAAVEGLLEGKFNVMAGKTHRDISFTPFSKATKHHLQLNPNLVRMLDILST